MSDDLIFNTHTKKLEIPNLRMPNPIMIGNNRFWAQGMSVKQMEKLYEWLGRAIQWRKQG